MAICHGHTHWLIPAVLSVTVITADFGVALAVPEAQTNALTDTALLMEIGFDHRAFAVSGLTASHLSDLLALLAVEDVEYATYHTAREEHLLRQRSLAILTERARSEGATETLSGEINAAREAADISLVEMKAAQEALQNRLLESLEPILTFHDHDLLSRAVRHHEIDLPDQFVVLDLDSAEWDVLSSALTKTAAGDELLPEELGMLAQAQTSGDIAIAQSRLQSQGALLRIAFAMALASDSQQQP